MEPGSGSGLVYFQEPVHGHGHGQRDNSKASTATCPSHGDGPPTPSAVAAEGGADAPSPPPLPAAPVDRPQERAREQAGSGSRGTNGSCSAAAGAVDLKGKDPDSPSSPRTAGSTTSPDSAWLVGAGAVGCNQQLVREAEKKKPDQEQIDGEGSQIYWEHVDHQTLPITEAGNHYRVTKDRPILLNLDAYSRFRPVLGDGECFYRSFIYSYLEQVLDRQDTEEQRLLDTIERVSTEYTNLGCTFEFRRSYRNIKVNKLLEGRPLYNLEFLQCLKSYCDAVNCGIMNEKYNPAERRSKGCKERNHKGSNKSSKSLEPNRLSSANSKDGARTTEKVCLSTVTEEHYMEQIQQLSEKTWEVMQRPGDSSKGGMFGECNGEGVGACVLGAAMDIFLVQPRDGGARPSRFQTLRRAGWSYWTRELKLVTRFGTSKDIPRMWSWENVMGLPAYGREGCDGCVMKAIATCTRALHCIAFERRYGAGTFRYQLSDRHVRYLINACRKAGVLAVDGATVPEVLLLMRNRGIWIRTQVVLGEICLLRFNCFGCLNLKASPSPPDAVAAYIRIEGPIIGALHAGPNYVRSDFDPEYVYRGDPGKANHAVVCMAYRFQDGELHIRILDNIASYGPLRWVLFEVFKEFYFIDVEPLDRAAQQENKTRVAGLQYILLED